MSIDLLTAAALAGIVPEHGAAGGDVAPSPLPAYFYEELQNMGSGAGWLYNAGWWAQPNTYFMIRLDTRTEVNGDGSNRVFTAGLLRAPGDAAADTVRRLLYVVNSARNGGEWPAGKPLRWAITVIGPNAADSPIKLVGDPADQVAGIAGVMSMFPATGVAACAAWFTDFWAELAAAMEQQQEAIPPPDIVYLDLEALGDVAGVAYNSPFYAGPELWPATQADPRANTYLIDGTRTLTQWLALRTTTLSGAPVPAWPAAGTNNVKHPANAEHLHRINAAYLTSYIHAMSQGIFAPLAAQWPDVRRGEWGVWTDSRVHPVRTVENHLGYHMHGFRGLMTDAVVIDYSYPHVTLASFFGATPGQPDLPGWNAVYQQGLLSDPLLPGRLGRASLVDRAKALRNLGLRVGPAIQLGLSIADRPAMRGAMLDCADAGMRHVQVFALGTPGIIGLMRDYTRLVEEANADMLATGRYFAG